jgi:hypothetical protein
MDNRWFSKEFDITEFSKYSDVERKKTDIFKKPTTTINDRKYNVNIERAIEIYNCTPIGAGLRNKAMWILAKNLKRNGLDQIEMYSILLDVAGLNLKRRNQANVLKANYFNLDVD